MLRRRVRAGPISEVEELRLFLRLLKTPQVPANSASSLNYLAHQFFRFVLHP
jgi:hypothetical protein